MSNEMDGSKRQSRAAGTTAAARRIRKGQQELYRTQHTSIQQTIEQQPPLLLASRRTVGLYP